MAYSNRNMDDLLARWTASNRQDPQLLFPGTHAEILVLLQEWWTRRKQSHAQLMALRAQLQDQSSAVLSSATATPPLSRAVKQKMASKALEIISQANALDSTAQHETLLASYLLTTLSSRGYRPPNHNPRITLEEAVCFYLAQVLPAFDPVKEILLLVDVAEQARLKAKQVEIATAIREKVGVDVSANAEVGAKVVEKMLGEYVEKGKGGVEEALRAMGGAPNLTAKEQKG